jgi:OOP family OmpA-OmpF porin
MKHLNKIIIAVVLIVGLNAQAQDSNNPWAVSFGVNALDTKTSAGGGKNWLDGHLSQPYKIKDNWNVLPTISYVGVTRYLGDNFSVGISGSLNKVSKYVSATNSGYTVTNPGDLMYYGIEGLVKYSFKSAIKSEKFDPTISLGVGYSSLDKVTYQTITPAVGVVYWATKTIGFEYSTKYVKSYEERAILNAANAPSMIQHSLGLVIQFGATATE